MWYFGKGILASFLRPLGHHETLSEMLLYSWITPATLCSLEAPSLASQPYPRTPWNGLPGPTSVSRIANLHPCQQKSLGSCCRLWPHWLLKILLSPLRASGGNAVCIWKCFVNNKVLVITLSLQFDNLCVMQWGTQRRPKYFDLKIDTHNTESGFSGQSS